MTRYAVVHTRLFESELATLWLTARDPRAVTDSSDKIDKLLANDPDLKGELVEGNLRRIGDGPIWVYYVVELDDCRVTLWSVRPARV
jgi:hypothetical protein